MQMEERSLCFYVTPELIRRWERERMSMNERIAEICLRSNHQQFGRNFCFTLEVVNEDKQKIKIFSSPTSTKENANILMYLLYVCCLVFKIFLLYYMYCFYNVLLKII